jgi:N-succinyldiaminopimelate aminotransferase
VRQPILASRLRGFETTIFAEMTRLAAEHGAVDLSQGYPDFPGPEFLKEAAIEAIRADRNQYARMNGELPLVRAIAGNLKLRYGLEYDPLREITVFSGATEALHCVFLSLCEPGDEVVMLEPYYDSYRAGCAVAGAVPRFVPLESPDFTWDPATLEAAFSDRTRLCVLNTPHNPTGRVLTRKEMEAVAELCRRFDVICVTDEVYDRLVFEGSHLSLAALPGMRERTVVINSTGKTFSLTGWKIGYAAAPAPLTAALVAAHQFVTFAVATPFQHAMVAALSAPDAYFTRYVAEYRDRRDRLVEGLQSCGFAVQPPQGTYFVLADIRPLGFTDDVAFCRHLVETVGVAAVPPSVFYDTPGGGRHLVRFAFCKKEETLRAAVDRLRKRFA